MNILEIIEKKEANKELNYKELEYVVNGFLKDEIKDYQMSSLLMAIEIKGMTEEETINLTKIMLNSGEKIDLSMIKGTKVDKHSTGGVGDKTSLVVLPLAASAGVKVAKMSGKGLGFTGGTIDKLESINGFKTELSNEKFIKQVNDIGISLVSQTNNLVPADKKIYALRDVTGTTESINLIASSIMSKKLASGSDKILLDVKMGNGAFMKNMKDARSLAKLMVKIGNKQGKETIALITNMKYPLGKTIGNGLEVKEAIETLKCKGEKNFTKLCVTEASYMLSMASNITYDKAEKIIKENLKKGLGYKKLEEFIKSQGGDINKIEIEKNKIPIKSSTSGYISNIDSLALAYLSNDLGAGRKNMGDKINHKVGIVLNKIYGDKVKENDILAYIVTKENINPEKYVKAFTISKEKPKKMEIILQVIK